jgi:hypothetical protein
VTMQFGVYCQKLGTPKMEVLAQNPSETALGKGSSRARLSISTLAAIRELLLGEKALVTLQFPK